VRKIERDWFGFKKLKESSIISKVFKIGLQNNREKSNFSQDY